MKELFFLAVFATISCSGQLPDSKKGIDYPQLPYTVETIQLGDKTYTEHFRNIETMPDSIASSWVRAQSNRTKDSIWSLPEKEKWTSVLEDIGNRYESAPYMFRNGENGSAFYLKYTIDGDITSLFSCDEKNGAEKMLISTDSLSQKNRTSYYISYYLPSWDGKHLAVEFNDFSGLTGLLFLLDATQEKLFTNLSPTPLPPALGALVGCPIVRASSIHGFP